MPRSYLLATYGVFGVMGAGLFGFGVAVAMDRERGLLTLKRAQPMPAGAYLVAKMAMAMLFAAIICALLAVLARDAGGVRMRPRSGACCCAWTCWACCRSARWACWLGSLVSGRGAPALVNLIYLPMAFLSGLWVPLTMLPPVLQTSRRCGRRIIWRTSR